MITKRLKKRRKGAHRLDMTGLREALKDRRCWTCLATTIVPDGEEEHWELIVDDSGNVTDILVEVVTQPEGQELTCRLDIRGSIEIPALGDEVLVCLPSGRIDFMPVITGFMSQNSIPNPAGQGPALGRIVVIRDEYLIHDGQGGAKEIAYKSDVQEVVDAIKNGVPGAMDGGLAYQTSMTGLLNATSTPTGTTVLKAK